jgi:HemY protein
VSPVSGRLDAFAWKYPQESITARDLTDHPAPETAPVTLAAAPAAPTITPEAQKPKPKPASSVVFPLVTSPDDPGPMDRSAEDEATQSSKPAKPVHLFGG